jgi:DNA-binding NarL/FixJ family response regulator
MDTVRIAIVDDHPIFLNGLNLVITQTPNFQVVIQAGNGLELLEALEKAVVMPDVVLLDIAMPKMDGLECSAILKEKYPDLKIIILTMNDQQSYIKHLIEIGVDSYLLKETVGAEIEKAIQVVLEGECYFDTQVQQILSKEISKKQNTPKHNIFLGKRELEVLGLLNKNKNKHEIAEELSISVLTVETHRKNLFKKFDVHSTTQLLFKAVKFDLIELE